MEGEKKIVVDASVVVKWFLDETHTANALAIRQDYANGLIDLVAPDLLPYEVLNALRYNPDFGKADLDKMASALDRYQIDLIPFKTSSIRIAYEYGISIYDASYVALAGKTGVELYTADEKLLHKLGDHRGVKHLSEYGT